MNSTLSYSMARTSIALKRPFYAKSLAVGVGLSKSATRTADHIDTWNKERSSAQEKQIQDTAKQPRTPGDSEADRNKAAKDHFSELRNGSRIHITRTGTCHHGRSTEKTCNYKNNCPPSDTQANWLATLPWNKTNESKARKSWNAHHLLPCEAVIAYLHLEALKDHRATINQVYRQSDWCINQAPNLVYLPISSAYSSPWTRGARPCHSIDHNITYGYNDEAVIEMHNRVWLKIEKASADQEPHFVPGDLSAELDAIAQYFKEMLEIRGKRTAKDDVNVKREEELMSLSRTNEWASP